MGIRHLYYILPGNDLNQLGEHAGHLRQVWGLTASPILDPCFKNAKVTASWREEVVLKTTYDNLEKN
jgi:hypothetical protein